MPLMFGLVCRATSMRFIRPRPTVQSGLRTVSNTMPCLDVTLPIHSGFEPEARRFENKHPYHSANESTIPLRRCQATLSFEASQSLNSIEACSPTPSSSQIHERDQSSNFQGAFAAATPNKEIRGFEI